LFTLSREEIKRKVEEPELDKKLARAIENGRLTATVDGESAVEKSNFIISILPLILDKENKPDLSAVLKVTETVSRKLRRGHVVGYETTLPIGTTETKLKPILEK